MTHLRKIMLEDPKNLGAEIGFLAILHTWGQTLQPHPHIRRRSVLRSRPLALLAFQLFPTCQSPQLHFPRQVPGWIAACFFATTNSSSMVSVGHSQWRRTSSLFCVLCFNRTGSSMPGPLSAEQNMSFTIWPVTLIASLSGGGWHLLSLLFEEFHLGPCNSAGKISRRGFGRSGRLASIVAAGSIGLGVHAS